MSFITSMKALAGAKRRISAGSASTTSRGVTPCSFAAVSMTTPGAVAAAARSGFAAVTCLRGLLVIERLLRLKASNFGWPR